MIIRNNKFAKVVRVGLVCLPAFIFSQHAQASNMLGVIGYEVIPAEIQANHEQPQDHENMQAVKSQKRSSIKSLIKRIAEVDNNDAARLVSYHETPSSLAN